MASPVVVEGDKYRSYLSAEDIKDVKWKSGASPNYDVVNKLFEEGRTKIWPEGSLEYEVQNLVKTWEMEMFHKTRIEDFRTIDPKKYSFSVNGRRPITLEEKWKIGGGYNAFLATSLPEKFRAYDPDKETVSSAHVVFTTAFPRGFALEILQVYSGPPVIVYKFRHWAYFEGPYKNYSPTGELIELFGIGIFQLDENSKIVKVEFFLNGNELLGGLLKGGASDGSSSAATDLASSCPFMKGTG